MWESEPYSWDTEADDDQPSHYSPPTSTPYYVPLSAFDDHAVGTRKSTGGGRLGGTYPVAEAGTRYDISRPARHDPVVGIYHSNGSADGRLLREGPRGGIYHIAESGNKQYVPQRNRETTESSRPARSDPAVGTYKSTGSANGRTIYLCKGPQGGTYYLTDSGNKRYL